MTVEACSSVIMSSFVKGRTIGEAYLGGLVAGDRLVAFPRANPKDTSVQIITGVEHDLGPREKVATLDELYIRPPYLRDRRGTRSGRVADVSEPA